MSVLFKHYVRVAALAMLSYLLLAFVLTTLVDPWRILRTSWMLTVLEPYRDFADHQRAGKAGLAKDPAGWDVAYIGSSRFEIGMSTDHAALTGGRVVNLGLAAGMTRENMAMAHYVMEHNPRLRLLIIGVDCGDLTSTLDMSGQTDFNASPLADGSFSVDRQMRYFIGARAVEESIATLRKFFKGEKSIYTLHGQRIGALPVFKDIRARVENHQEYYRFQARAFESEANAPVNLEKCRLLRDVLLQARSVGIRVIVVVPPRHALTQIHPSSDFVDAAPWARDRRIFAEMCGEVNQASLPGPAIVLRDFYTFSTLATISLPKRAEADQRFPLWYDLEHYPTSVGSKMLDRLLLDNQSSSDDSDWGVDVLTVGIDQHLERLRQQHAGYCQSHSEDVAWMRGSVLNARGGEGAVDGRDPNFSSQ